MVIDEHRHTARSLDRMLAPCAETIVADPPVIAEGHGSLGPLAFTPVPGTEGLTSAEVEADLA